jgi:glycerate 2-kinase
VLTILVAASGFKESLGADAVARAIAEGVRRADPDAKTVIAPLVDGGEGFARALVDASGGEIRDVEVTGPVGRPVESHFGILGGSGPRTAALEMAAAAGLRLVPADGRDPLVTTTYGVGELIGAALDAGAERILVGCGDSGTNDGGAGMAQALGVALLDEQGEEIGRGAEELLRLASIDLSQRDPRLDDVRIDVACNITNVLCGPRGVARVYGPQKGASPETVEQLTDALERWAAVLEETSGVDVRDMPGGGASGGLGSGLKVLAGATLHSRYDVVMEYVDLDELLDDADLVITAEGAIDGQTAHGKIPAEVGRRAKQRDLPVIALAGTIGDGARDVLECGIDAYASVLEAPVELEEAMRDAARLVEGAAEATMRMVLVGRDVAG